MDKDLDSFLLGQADKAKENYISGLADWIKKRLPALNVVETSDTLQIAFTLANSREDVGSHIIDLKQYFAMSAKKKTTKDGGWYIRVPLRVKATAGRTAYGRKTWDSISKLSFGQTYIDSEDAEKVQKVLGVSQQGVIPELRYQWKSANVTKNKWGKSGKRSNYFAIRTVSNNSVPQSWLVNRQGFSKNTSNKELIPYISSIIKHQLEICNQENSQ